MATSESSSSDYSLSASTGGDMKRSKLNFSKDEEALMIRMYNLVGERWSLIAGRIPGRTAEEIESFWMTRYASSDYGKRK